MGIDIAGPFADAPGHQQYVVTTIDYASNIPECLLATSITLATIIKWLKTLLSRYGNPDQIVTNNGPQFVSAEFASFLADHGISHVCSSVYILSENGLVEVFNRSLKYGIQCFSHDALAGKRASNSS